MDQRYERNANTFSAEEQLRMREKRVCIVGLGGLGGYVASQLARFGVGNLCLIDGDSFSSSNLNRQLFCTLNTLGQKKAKVAKAMLVQINDEVHIEAISEFLTKENAKALICDHDVVMDCLDNIETRRLLLNICRQNNIPMIHGAIAGFYGQVMTVFPQDHSLDSFLIGKNADSSKSLGNPSFTPGMVASIQVSETIKLLTNKGNLLRNRMLMIDLLTNDFELINI